jgi:hypothetical protein
MKNKICPFSNTLTCQGHKFRYAWDNLVKTIVVELGIIKLMKLFVGKSKEY